MSTKDTLQELKAIARKLQRAKRIQHTPALNLVAAAIGYPHWKAVALAEKRGWRLSSEHLESADALLRQANPMPPISEDPDAVFMTKSVSGELMGHRYMIGTVFDDVAMQGQGWTIFVPENPKKEPEIGLDRRMKNNPILDDSFRRAAVAIALECRERVHARMASDWPRRSTVPARDGTAEHPLWGGASKMWHCLHCGGEFTGNQMAKTLWHCPDTECDGSPIDIYASKWWEGPSPGGQPGPSGAPDLG